MPSDGGEIPPAAPSFSEAPLLGIDEARGPDSRLLVLESCNSVWLFDARARRFRRVLKGLDLDLNSVATGWRLYYHLDLETEEDAFVVHLNAAGSQLLRARRHGDRCPYCGGEATGEFSIDELRQLART